MSSVRTDAEGWQVECWKLARAKQHFEIHGFQPGHHHFIEELRMAYDYRVEMVQNKIIFTPLNVTPKVRSQDRSAT